MKKILRNATLAILLGSAGTLSAQTTYTFSACGALQQYGPTQIQADAAYASTPLAGNVIVVGGIQYWVVPFTGQYEIQAFGGQGYGTFGGRGAHMTGEFTLTAGDTLKILVGQYAGPYLSFPATTYNHQFGGGGGSFVTTTANVPLIVAGGGGGNHGTQFLAACDGQITTSGSIGALGTTVSAGGTNGAGGLAASSADGGGGLLTNGAGIAGGRAFVNGGNGGFDEGIGGFGGGGGTSSWNNYRGGGGGGYSGGGAGNNGSACCSAGGGGGSYNAGINQTNLAGVQLGDGSVIIRSLSLPPNDGGIANILGFTPPVCAGTYPLEVTLRNYGSNQINPITIQWTLNGTPQPDTTITTVLDTVGSTAGDSLNVIIGSVTINAATTIRVWTTLPNNTTDPTLGNDTLELSIAAPALVSAALDNDVTCPGGSDGAASSTSIGGTPGYTYLWSNGATTSSLVNVIAGTYTLTFTDADGCTDTASVMVPEPPAFATTDSIVHVACNGDSSAAITLTPAGGTPGYTIFWGNGDTTWAIGGLGAGIYTYLITDANGCQDTGTATVLQPNAIALTTSVTDEVPPTSGAIDLTVNGGTAGYTFLWSNGATTEDITGISAGTYTVTVTDANGCTSTVTATVSLVIAVDPGTAAFDVTVAPNPSQGRFSVHLDGTLGESTIEVTDLLGRQVAQIPTTDTRVQIDLQGQTGVYLLTVHNNGAQKTTRVVVTK